MVQTGCHFGALALLFVLSASLTAAKLVHHTTHLGDDELSSQHGPWGDDRLATFSSWGRVLQQEVTVYHVRQMDENARCYACRVVKPCLPLMIFTNEHRLRFHGPRSPAERLMTVLQESAALSPAADSTSVPPPVAFFYLAGASAAVN